MAYPSLFATARIWTGPDGTVIAVDTREPDVWQIGGPLHKCCTDADSVLEIREQPESAGILSVYDAIPVDGGYDLVHRALYPWEARLLSGG